MAPSAASADTAASSSAPSGGRATVDPGWTSRTVCTSSRPAACWAARSVERPLAMSDGIVGAENGMAETWISAEETAWRSSARTAAAFAAPSVSASTSVPSARSYPSAIRASWSSSDGWITRSTGLTCVPLASRSSAATCAAREPVGAIDASNAVSTRRPSGSNAGGAVISIVVERRSGTSGVRTTKITAVSKHGDLRAGAPEVDAHGVDQRVRPADAADRREVDRRAEPTRPSGLDGVVLRDRGGEDREFGPFGERRSRTRSATGRPTRS